MQTGDYRELLRHELARRCGNNPRYSLRAFAKALGLSHTVLSLVLSGKRPLSKKATAKVSEALAIAPNVALAYDRIDLDTFAVLSDWYHYAILSALEIPGAKFEARYLAKRLGIHEMEAASAMERLQRMNLVAKKAGGKWKQVGGPLKVENRVSTAATRKFHTQLLEKAQESLENDGFEKRDFSAMTFAMDPALVPYARERIRQFRRALMAELEAAGKPKQVYNLTVQIYPVSKNPKENA